MSKVYERSGPDLDSRTAKVISFPIVAPEVKESVDQIFVLIPVKDDGTAFAPAVGQDECGTLSGERADADVRYERDAGRKATKHRARRSVLMRRLR
jgi:hypothetical protein